MAHALVGNFEARLQALELARDRAEAAAGARLALLEDQQRDLKRSQIEFEQSARLRALEQAKKLAEATAEARLRVIEEQQRALDAYRRRHILERLRVLAAPRIGVLYQYAPRQLKVPHRYTAVQAPKPAPAISIVTPTRNQAVFLERTLQSVLGQGYPGLEYIVQDGLSIDETPGVLDRYSQALAHVESCQDGGQSNALNLGFARATGDILAYLNSDDLLLPGALNYVAAYFAQHPETDVVYGLRIVIDEYDAEIGRWVLPPHDDEALSWGDYIPQETLFWRRSIWEKAGGHIDESFRFAMDWDLVLRFREAGARFVRLPRFLGAFRVHPHQKTSAQMEDVGRQEMARLRQRCHGRAVSPAETNWALRGYLSRHLACHYSYRIGLARY